MNPFQSPGEPPAGVRRLHQHHGILLEHDRNDHHYQDEAAGILRHTGRENLN